MCSISFLVACNADLCPVNPWLHEHAGTSQMHQLVLCAYSDSRNKPLSPVAVPSALWGCRGELWNATAGLLDWSYAGYAAGDTSIPGSGYVSSFAADIKADYGAKGDGKTDDTAAFLNFIADAKSRAVLRIPAGMHLQSVLGSIVCCTQPH